VNPGRYNITVYNGTTFSLSPSWQINNVAVNLTDYTADMQVRDVSNNLIVEMSTDNGRAVITPATGTVTLTLSAEETSAGNLPAGTYSYDLNLTAPDTTVYKILQGVFVVNASVVQ
jgi:hypothetical protein